MLATPLYQPSVAAAVTHLTAVFYSARQSSTLASHSRGRRVQETKQNGKAVRGSVNSKRKEGKSDVEQILQLLLHNEKGQKFLPLFLSRVPDPACCISHPAPELQQHIEKLSSLLPHYKHPMCSVLTDHLNHNGHLAGGNYMQVRHFGLFIKGLKPNGFFPNGGKKVQEKGEELPKILKDEEDPVVKLKLKLAYLTAQLENQKNGDGAAKVIAEHRKKMLRIVAGLCLGTFIIYKVLLQGSVGRNAGDMLYGAKNYEINPEVVSVTFNDVKGCDEAKEELEDIVDFLKNGERFLKMGAKLPKGLLLVGSPGTGKTLLAKAIAGEAGVPFFHASGSEFDEVFVGQGSKRVRNLFENAKKRAPCIIFIDEIDSVGGKRTSTGITPYANQTVNQLLSEMDGFDSQESIIVIGATNKKGNLDSALLRPGRFDMEVHVRPPDNDGRKELFRLYLSKCKHDGKINIDSLAKQTIGMTGADIANLVNQAAIIATLKGGSHVTMDDLAEARDKVTMGPAWKNKKIDEEELWRTAYHEAGHTIVAYFTDHALPLHKVTIEPRGEALGVTMSVPDKEPYGMTRAQCLARMDVGMGGRAGEELKYGVEFVGNGASSDFQMCTAMATLMVKKWGMSEKVGKRVHSDPNDGNLIQVNETSPELQKLIDNEINRFLEESYNRAMNILNTHKKEHQLLAEALMKYETLDVDEIKAAISGKPINRAPRGSLKNKGKPDKDIVPKIGPFGIILAPTVDTPSGKPDLPVQ